MVIIEKCIWVCRMFNISSTIIFFNTSETGHYGLSSECNLKTKLEFQVF